MPRLMAKALLVGAFFFAAASDAGVREYPHTTKSTRITVTVNMIWAKDYTEADLICSYYAGIEPRGTILACYHIPSSTIVAVEPKDFNDHFNLMILGHEFWHALGADHPDEPEKSAAN